MIGTATIATIGYGTSALLILLAALMIRVAVIETKPTGLLMALVFLTLAFGVSVGTQWTVGL